MKKTVLLIIIFLACSFLPMPVFASEEDSIPEDRQLPRLVDDADLLTEEEETKLHAGLDEISERQQCDVAIVTVYSLEGKTAMEYADDFYDYNGYGYGAGDDGILLLLSMEYRDWWMTTYGFGIVAFTDAGQAYIFDQMKTELAEANYYTAFTTFAESCDKFLTQAHSGTAYDVGELPRNTVFEIFIGTIVSLVLGLIIAALGLNMMTKPMKSVRKQAAADNYVLAGSMNITNRYEEFQHKNISRIARPKESSSSGGSGGSSTHSSSSGRSHGGSGGKF